MDLFNTLFGKIKSPVVTVDKLNELGEETNDLFDRAEQLAKDVEIFANNYAYKTYTISKTDLPEVHVCSVKVYVPGFTKEDINVTTEQLNDGIEICVIAEKKVDKNSTKYEYKAVVNKGTPEQFKARLKDEWVIVEYVAKTSGKNKIEIE